MRRSLILNILCPSGRNILMCFVVLMIVVATLITFILFDDITASPISVIYHIHSDIPHDWMTDILYKNYSHASSMEKATAAKAPQVSNSIGDFSWLSLFENENNEIFVNGKSFSQIIHDRLRPSLTNLLPQNELINDTNVSLHENDAYDDVSDDDDNINKHLEWYSSKPIPHLLQHKLKINKYETVSTKLIYHPQLQHFILLVITRNPKTNQWALDIFERDAKPFLWRYAFDTKHLYKDITKVDDHNSYDSDNKQNELFEAMRNLEFWKSFDLALDVIVTELKTVGVDISLGFDNLSELRDILQEIIVKESTENPSFHAHDFAENNIEKYIGRKTEFYKSYYDIHADKIKVVYTDWYHSEHVDINGTFSDKQSVFKWSANYKYLLIHSYVSEHQDYKLNQKRSQLHLFEFECSDLNYNESIRRLKEHDLRRRKRKIKNDLLDKLQDYGYYKSSALNKIYSIKSHQFTTKHVSSDNKFAKMTAIAFTPCAIYYALQNDYKLIRAVQISELFNNLTDINCGTHNHNTYARNEDLSFADDDGSNQSFYEYQDSLIEITKQLTPRKDVMSNNVHDMMVLNASTLLITQQLEHNSHYMSYSTALLHIPDAYQYQTHCNNDVAHNSHRWYVIKSRHLYRDHLNSNKYYYRHDVDAMHKTLSERRSEHKFDRFGSISLIPSIHYSSTPIIGMKDQQRKKENKLHFEPLLFLSATQNDASSVITSTPYFISINNELFDYDDTVEIVNLKSMTTFTQSALNKKGDLLAILDNTDSILVLKKNENRAPPKLTQSMLNVDDLSFNEFLLQSGIKDDLSNILNNESMVDILNQFIKNEVHNDADASNDEVEWKVSSEFSPTSIMSHLKPVDIICISLDDDDNATIDGYIVVLFENGVISSYVMKSAKDAQYQNGAQHGSSAILPNGTIDFWLGTCIDWIELMFLMSFAAYFVCSCCRRSSLRIGLGRERVINANLNAAQAQPLRPRRGALDVLNNDPLQPINNENNNNRPPLLLNDLAPNQAFVPQVIQADDDEDDDDDDDDEVVIEDNDNNNANIRAGQAAMLRMAQHNNNAMEQEEEEEKDEHNLNIVEQLATLNIEHDNEMNDDTTEDIDSSPLSSLSPAINPDLSN